MRGLCDTCDQAAELFQWAGREDRNCAECHATLRRLVQLYETFKELEQTGGDANGLIPAIRHIEIQLANRIRLSTPPRNANAYMQ